MSADTFNGLLDRHLRLAERVKAPHPEQAQSEVEKLIADIDSALDTGKLINEPARRMAVLRGQWQNYLATAAASAPATDVLPATVPLASILKALSAPQAWSIGVAIVSLLVGAFAVGQYEAKLEAKEKTSTLTSQVEAHKAHVEALESENAQLKESERTRNILAQERLLAALILRVRDAPREPQPRQELLHAMKKLEADRIIAITYDRKSKRQLVEVLRTAEVWFVPD